MRFSVSLLVASAFVALGSAKRYPSIFPALADLKPLQAREVEPYMTNGERFARGLPPAAPRHRRGSRIGSGKHFNMCFAGPKNLTLELFEDHGVTSLGYISDTLDKYGSLVLAADATVTPIEVTVCGSHNSHEIIFENLVGSTRPFWGLTQGTANSSPDLGPGSLN